MAKTRQVLKLEDGAYQYKCIRDLDTGVYKLYWMRRDLYGKEHRELLGTASNIKPILQVIKNDIKNIERI